MLASMGGRRSTRIAISCPLMPSVRVLLGGSPAEYRRSSTVAGRKTCPGRPEPIPKASEFLGTQATRRQLQSPAACSCCLFPLIHHLPPIIDLATKTQVTPVDILRLRNHTVSFPFSVGFSGMIFWKILFGDESMIEWESEKNIFDEKIFLFFFKKKIKNREKSEKNGNGREKIPKNHGRCVVVNSLRSTCFFTKNNFNSYIFLCMTGLGGRGRESGKCCGNESKCTKFKSQSCSE